MEISNTKKEQMEIILDSPPVHPPPLLAENPGWSLFGVWDAYLFLLFFGIEDLHFYCKTNGFT